MRRVLFAVVVALALVVPHSATATVSPALSCPDPAVLTGYEDGIAFPGGYRVNVDGWTHTGKYTMSVCSPSDWSSVANVKTGVKQVRAYNASERLFSDWWHCSSQPRLDSFTKLKSTYSHVAPDAGSYNFAFDIFAGSGACNRPLTEIMLFTEVRDVDLPTPQLHRTIDGVAYDIYYVRDAFGPGGNYIQMRLVEEQSHGAVNWKHVLKFLIRKSLVVASDTLVFLRYGVEILSTFGEDVTFQLTGFDVRDARVS